MFSAGRKRGTAGAAAPKIEREGARTAGGGAHRPSRKARPGLHTDVPREAGAHAGVPPRPAQAVHVRAAEGQGALGPGGAALPARARLQRG